MTTTIFTSLDKIGVSCDQLEKIVNTVSTISVNRQTSSLYYLSDGVIECNYNIAPRGVIRIEKYDLDLKISIYSREIWVFIKQDIQTNKPIWRDTKILKEIYTVINRFVQELCVINTFDYVVHSNNFLSNIFIAGGSHYILFGNKDDTL